MFGHLRRSSASSSTRCSPEPENHHHRQSTSTPPPASACLSRRQSSAAHSERSCESLTADGTRRLWRCMLELQGRYGCYHCTRMDLAMEAGDDEGLSYMPNRFIIDTLNDSVVDLLPEEGWELLDRCLHPENDVQGATS